MRRLLLLMALAGACAGLTACTETLRQTAVREPAVRAAPPARASAVTGVGIAPRPTRAARSAGQAEAAQVSSCAAPQALEQSLPLLPPGTRDALLETLSAGTALAGARGQWRVEVRQIKHETVRLDMPAPAFGCNNPGLGVNAQLGGRNEANSLWGDVDCQPEAQAGGRPRSGNISPAIKQARDAVTAQIARLKTQDRELTGPEQSHALALAKVFQQAASQWSQAPTASFDLPALAGMETLRDQVILQCTAKVGRATAESQALVEQSSAAMAAVFDAVLARQADSVNTALRAASGSIAMQAELRHLFPTPFLDQRARAHAAIAPTLGRELARVQAIDAQAKLAKAREVAERDRIYRENSPEVLARKRNLEKAAANTPPSVDEMRELLIDTLSTARGGAKGTAYRRTGTNLLEAWVQIPVIGTTLMAYRAEIEVRDLSCKPMGRKQRCAFSYIERPDAKALPANTPPQDMKRSHHAEVSWTAEGLQSPDLNGSLREAHKVWFAALKRAAEERWAHQERLENCKSAMPSNSSVRAIGNACGY